MKQTQRRLRPSTTICESHKVWLTTSLKLYHPYAVSTRAESTIDYAILD